MKSGYDLSDEISTEALAGRRVAVITSTFNSEITSRLKEGALKTLSEWGLSGESVLQIDVPGAYELPLAAGWALKEKLDAVIALGCVIRGETTHYDYVCQSAERGLSRLQLKYLKPVVFGVLTTENYDQALARAGGAHGHKGEEAAWAALRMLTLKSQVRNEEKD